MPNIIDLDNLTDSERLDLIGRLWDQIATEPNTLPVSPELASELDRRIEEYEQDPSAASSWDDVKSRIRNRR